MGSPTKKLLQVNAQTAGLGRRLIALQHALELSHDRIDKVTVDEIKSILARAGQRTSISGEKTVVALVGPTGAGKSSLFNALTGEQFSEVAVRRPTTAEARAVVWGSELPNELLDWLEISQRNLIESTDPELTDLVLLDLPDYDSVATAHQETVNRLIKVVDALIWVVDPQKYADAALHEGYLQPLREYAEVMLVAFNKADTLSEPDLNRCVRDMRRLLNDSQLEATRIMTTAAAFDIGVTGLLDVIRRTARAKVAMVARLTRDVSVAAYDLEIELGKSVPTISQRQLAELSVAVSEVVGIPEIAEAAAEDWLSRGRAVTGWPFVSKRYHKPGDPLLKLRTSKKVTVDLTSEDAALGFDGAVQQAKLEKALRLFTDIVDAPLTSGWKKAVWEASHANSKELLKQLNDIASQERKPAPDARWWSGFRVLKIALMLAIVVGIGWLVLGPILSAAGYQPLPAVTWVGLPVPVWLIGIGLVGGIASGLLGRLLVVPGARVKAHKLSQELLDQVSACVQVQVADPVKAELDRLEKALQQIRIAIK